MRAMLLAGAAAIPLALFTINASAQAPAPQPPSSGPTAPGPTSPLPGGGPGGGDARGGEMGATQAPGGAATPQTADTMPPPDQMNPRQVETSPPAGKKAGQASGGTPADPKRAGTAQGEAPKGDMKKDGKKPDHAAGAAGGNREMTAEKRQTIKRDISKVNARPVTNINFSVSVGTAVPRSVEMHVLPVTVVEVYPQYRGYQFFVLADGRIVIVEPSTFEIVTIIAG